MLKLGDLVMVYIGPHIAAAVNAWQKLTFPKKEHGTESIFLIERLLNAKSNVLPYGCFLLLKLCSENVMTMLCQKGIFNANEA